MTVVFDFHRKKKVLSLVQSSVCPLPLVFLLGIIKNFTNITIIQRLREYVKTRYTAFGITGRFHESLMCTESGNCTKLKSLCV